MSDFYILEGHRAKKASLKEWAKWFERADRIVDRTYLPNGYTVSTVFLGLDHSFGSGPPLLFETMVFHDSSGFDDKDCLRCSRWSDAEKQHKSMVNKWKKRVDPTKTSFAGEPLASD